MKPFGNRIAIQPNDNEIGDYIVPDTQQERPQRGTVVSVGPDVKYIEPGQTVLYSLAAAREVIVDGTRYVLLKEDDNEIFAVID